MTVQIEQQIREVIAMDDVSARAFCDALFGRDGLFNRLADSGLDREAVAKSPLFQAAQERMSQLERMEADARIEAIRQMHRQAAAQRQANGQAGPQDASGIENTSRKGLTP
jgi:hypothetical protein